MVTNNSLNYKPVNHNVIIGATGNGINNVAPAATSGTPFCSAGSSSDPAFNTTPTVTQMTVSNTPVNPTDTANKSYVDAAIAAVNPGTSVYAATTVNIPGTYLNGASGIGATFVTTATGAFTLDGTTPPALSRILFKNQSTTFQNGAYVLTTNGSLGVGSTFTRAVDYDQPSDINSTGVIAVLNGTVNQLTGWLINSIVTNVGVDPITYIQYNAAPISTTQYDVLVGGASNTVVSVGPGSSGQVLQSAGNAANPAYSTATYPATAGTSGNVLTSNGTNFTSSAAPVSSKVTTFVANGTWTPDPRMISANIYIWNGGGGGGSGACAASGNASGGGGGAGSAVSTYVILSSNLQSSSYTVTIGSGGTGGTGGTGASHAGSPGGISSLGVIKGSSNSAGGGTGGINGTPPGGFGNPTYFGSSNSNNFGWSVQGGSGSSTGTLSGSSNAAGGNFCSATGGGGGIGYTTTTAGIGGAGGNIFSGDGTTVLVAGGLAGANTGATAGNGNSPGAFEIIIGGTGGGGGGHNNLTTAGSGGNGATPGGGGGGGAGNLTGNASGSGGNGGDGQIIVVEFF